MSGDLVTYVQRNLKEGKNVPHCLKRHLLLGRLDGSGPVSSFSLLIPLQKYGHSDPPRCGQEAPWTDGAVTKAINEDFNPNFKVISNEVYLVHLFVLRIYPC